MEFDFLAPVNPDVIAFVDGLSQQHLGRKVSFHTGIEFPDLTQTNIAIIGVLENRGRNIYEEADLSLIRRELYSLYPGNWHVQVADLGDIYPGNTIEDTYFAVQQVASSLLRKNVLLLIIGGSQDLTYPLYRAYDNLEQMVNLTAIDAKFDFGRDDEGLNMSSYLTRIIADEPNNLFNFINLGYQTYYNSQEEIDLVEKLFFDAYRLGDVCARVEIAEPVLRDTDIVSLDLTAIKSADSGNLITFTPNGFNGKEICALSRYAGISDKVSSFGIFNHDNSPHESVLISQIIWYFIEGFHYRSNEYPFRAKGNYIKYIVPIDDDKIIFYKSNITDRWWIEMPFISQINNKLKNSPLLPCSYEEYLGACDNEMPERWLKAQRKNFI